jgi:hypothetical protein
MNFKITEIDPLALGQQRLYTQRVSIFGSFNIDKITEWLKENEIPFGHFPLGVLYLDRQGAELLVLRWS